MPGSALSPRQMAGWEPRRVIPTLFRRAAQVAAVPAVVSAALAPWPPAGARAVLEARPVTVLVVLRWWQAEPPAEAILKMQPVAELSTAETPRPAETPRRRIAGCRRGQPRQSDAWRRKQWDGRQSVRVFGNGCERSVQLRSRRGNCGASRRIRRWRAAARAACATASRESSPTASQGGRILRPGEWEPSPDPPPKKDKDKDDKDDDHFDKNAKKLAAKRGEDWGLRNAGRGSVGVTRPIHIECYGDRLVVISERGSATNRVIPLGPRTAASIDPLISAIWEQMEVWGMAGRGMYWRPSLQVDVAPDAERRFRELSVLLEGSGLTVERK